MPQEKRPRRHVFWWTCGQTLSHCGFLVAYLVNGLLLILAGSLLFLLFARDVPVPRFLVKALESRLEAEGLSQRVDSIQFDTGGRILFNGIRLFSNSYEEPLIQLDHALVGIDLSALLFGEVRAHSIRFSNGRLLSPSAVSPTGLPRGVVHKISGTIRLAAGGLRIEQVSFQAGQVRGTVSGSIQLPESKTSSEPKPGLNVAIAQLVSQIPRIIRIQNSMAPLENPMLRIRVAPNRNQGIDASVDLTADSYRTTKGTAVRELQTRLDLTTERGQISSIRAAGRVLDANQADVATLSNVTFQAVWKGLPSREYPYPDRLQINIGEINGRGTTLRNTTLNAWSPVAGQVGFEGSAVLGRQTIDLHGNVVPGEGRAQLTASGRAGTDWLEIASRAIGSDVTYYADLSRHPVYRVGVELGPAWKWSEARFEVMAEDLMARGVLLDNAYARGRVTPAGVEVDQIEIRQGKTRTSMAYQDIFGTRDYRFLVRGAIRPLAISRWFGPWWEDFWDDFDVPEEGGRCDLNIFGNWLVGTRVRIMGEAEVSDIGLKGTRFEDLRMKLFIRPHYFDIYDATGSRKEGSIEGDFQLLYERGNRLPVEQHFDVRSTADLKSIAGIFGPGGIEMLAPYDYEIPPRVEFSGAILRSGTSWDTDLSVLIDTDNLFRYEGFPLEALEAKVRILNKRVELPHIRGTYAGGSLEAEAWVNHEILTFDATLKNAGFQQAIETFGAYLDRDDPPAETDDEGRFQGRNFGGVLNLQMQAEGNLGDFASYIGKGRFDITEAELARIQLFGAISAALQSTMFRFSTLRFTEASSDFEINRNEIFFPNLEVNGPLAAIKSEGSYDVPSGSLDFHARFFPFNRGGLAVFSILDTVLNPFSYFFEIKMVGTLSNPKLRVSLGGNSEGDRPFAIESPDPLNPPPTPSMELPPNPIESPMD